MEYNSTHTITAGEAAGTDDIVLELGFVPTRLVIKNRTNDYTFEWNSSMASDEYWMTVGTTGVDTFEDTGVETFVVIDGSDKTNNVSTSFGMKIIGGLANISDAVEVLDICAIRDDAV